MRVLILEDYQNHREAFEALLATYDDIEVVITAFYRIAKDRITSGEHFNLILLDNRILVEYLEDVDNIPYADLRHHVQDIGYFLIPLIQEHLPQAHIVGTSGATTEELGDIPVPTETVEKVIAFRDAEFHAFIVQIRNLLSL